jgi:hypothetical protein
MAWGKIENFIFRTFNADMMIVPQNGPWLAQCSHLQEIRAVSDAGEPTDAI